MGGLISLFKNILKYMGIGYLLMTSIVGSLVLAWPFVLVIYNGIAPAPWPVQLPNGLIFKNDFKQNYVSNIITKPDGTVFVMSDVRRIMWSGKTVYGTRKALDGEVYYFVCHTERACTDNQHLSEAAFKHLVRNRALPPFHWRRAKTLTELLWDAKEEESGRHWLFWPFQDDADINRQLEKGGLNRGPIKVKRLKQ